MARPPTPAAVAGRGGRAGHTSGIGCVGFDAREEAVVAGAASGTLKLWDLCQARRRRIRRRHRRRRRRRLGGRRRRRGGVGRDRKKRIGILNARGCHGVVDGVPFVILLLQ